MLISIDIPVQELLRQMLEYHSPHYLLYQLAELERHPDKDFFADECSKLLPKYEEL